MEFTLNISNPYKSLQSISSALDGTVEQFIAEDSIKFPESGSIERISCAEFNNGISMFCLKGSFAEELTLKLTHEGEAPLRLLFCLSGELIHYIEPDNLHYKLVALQSAISSGTGKSNEFIKIPSSINILFYMVEINRQEYHRKIVKNSKMISDPLVKIFDTAPGDAPFLYENKYNLLSLEVIHEMEGNKFTGLVRRLFLEAKVMEAISYQFNQYLDDSDPYSQLSLLKKKDFGQMIEARQILLSDLQKPPIIKELARMIGTNENKLKRGFKQVFGKTINNYIIDKRLEHARILLAEEEYSVKEISEKTGYRSQSAFTKVFKKKFGITPKQFLKRHDK